MRPGQHLGRDERIRQTAEWLNATPLQLHGDPLVCDPQQRFDQAMQLCHTIRGLFQHAHVDQIVVQETNPLVLTHLKSLLTGDELSRVTFQHQP